MLKDEPALVLQVGVSSALCAALVGCASSADTTPAVVRTPPPQTTKRRSPTTWRSRSGIRRRTPRSPSVARAGCLRPGRVHHLEPGLGRAGGLLHAHRRSDGKDTIRINTKQYYFWFLGNTIAGITPRIELCPGIGASFEAPPTAAAVATTASPVPPSGRADRAAASKAASEAQGDVVSQEDRHVVSETTGQEETRGLGQRHEADLSARRL